MSVLALVGDLHLLQHLTDNHLDVLVVDQHALQPVDLLDFVDQIGREFLDALDRQDVVRRRIALDDEIALFDDVAVLQMDVLALRNEVLRESPHSCPSASIEMRRLFL